MHARSRSRRVVARSDAAATLAAQTDPNQLALSDSIVECECEVSDLLASIAPAAIEWMQRASAVAPGYDTFNLTAEQADALVRQIFEAAGIPDDFMPWRERFPTYEPEA